MREDKGQVGEVGNLVVIQDATLELVKDGSRSGGINLDANDVNVDGDVVGRDKIIQHIHYHNSQSRQIVGAGTQNARVFISYKRNVDPDDAFAIHLYRMLNKREHQPFLDQKEIVVGMDWANEIQRQVEGADYFIILLSSESADSENVAFELELAHKHKVIHGKPVILPVRLAYEDSLPYQLSSYLQRLQYARWRDKSDTEKVVTDLVRAIEGNKELPIINSPPSDSIADRLILSDDGRAINALPPGSELVPLPIFDPRALLEAPRGAVRLKSKFYVERKGDDDLQRQMQGAGTTTTIMASRQMGKTSLLARGVRQARDAGQHVVYIDFQRVSQSYLSTLDNLLRYFADEIAMRLLQPAASVEAVWSSTRSAQDKLTTYLERQVLPQVDAPILLAIDEADRLLEKSYKTDFFGLLRAWDSHRAHDELWEKLNIAMVISTQPHLLISDLSVSPFTVGMHIRLRDFDEAQVADLNQRHGSPVKENELTDFMRLLGGHPYLTRQALYTMVDQSLSWADFTRIASTEQGPFGSHLRTYLLLLSERPGLVEGMRGVLLMERCTDATLLYRLSAAGLIRETDTDGGCVPRNGLYAEYFGAKL